jgi:hypothetical protein
MVSRRPKPATVGSETTTTSNPASAILRNKFARLLEQCACADNRQVHIGYRRGDIGFALCDVSQDIDVRG